MRFAVGLPGRGRRAAVSVDRSDPTRPAVRIRGEVDADNARRVADTVVAVLTPDTVEVHLDLTGLTRIGIDGAYVLFRLVRAARCANPRTALTVTGACTRSQADLRRLGLEAFIAHDGAAARPAEGPGPVTQG